MRSDEARLPWKIVPWVSEKYPWQGAHLRVGGGLRLYLKQCLEGAVHPSQPKV
jgi:hypothetical protein